MWRQIIYNNSNNTIFAISTKEVYICMNSFKNNNNSWSKYINKNLLKIKFYNNTDLYAIDNTTIYSSRMPNNIEYQTSIVIKTETSTIPVPTPTIPVPTPTIPVPTPTIPITTELIPSSTEEVDTIITSDDLNNNDDNIFNKYSTAFYIGGVVLLLLIISVVLYFWLESKKNKDEYYLCYSADFEISNFNNHTAFIKALKNSKNQIEIVLGFKDSSGNVIHDCFEENSNRTAKLVKS
jgi:hypothetical protein